MQTCTSFTQTTTPSIGFTCRNFRIKKPIRNVIFWSKVDWDSTFMLVKQNKTGWFPGESNSFFSVISRLPNLQPCQYSNYVYGKKTPAQSIINNLQFRWIIDEWSISGFHFSFPVCKYILLHTCNTCTSIYIYICTQLTCTTIKCVSTCSFMIVCCIPVFLFSNPLPAS